MGVEALAFCFALLGVVLLFYAVKAYQMKNALSKEVAGMLGMAAAAIWSYCLAMISREYFSMSVAYSINFICFDGLVYCLYQYSRTYTSMAPLSEKQKKIVQLVIGCDVISLLLNPLMGHAVRFSQQHVGTFLYSIAEMWLPYQLHLLLCYLLFALSLVHLIKKTVKSNRLYQIKYSLITLVLLIAAVLNGLFVFTNLSVDFSVLVFALAGLVIFIFTFHYVPNRLQTGILDYFMRVSPDGIVLFDADEMCIYRNTEARRLFEQEETIERRQIFCEKWKISFANEERTILDEYGKQIFLFTLRELEAKNGKGMGSIFWARNITKEKQLAEEKEFLLKHDPLTGIYNREYFFYQTTQLLQKSEQPMVMIALNVERFKLINDIYGIETGNLVLKKIAEQLKETAADNCIYGRISSDQFAICLPDIYSVETLEENSRGKMMAIGHGSFPVVIKFGVYRIVDKAMPAESAYDRATLALNQVKGQYHTNVGYYDHALRERMLKQQSIVNDMENALREEQFELYLQPQMNHTNGQIIGAEALVRWEHPERGTISPAEFIPVFEENGFITKMDQYVWEKACQIIQKLRNEGREHCSISVNISTKDFYYVDLYEVFTGLIDKYQIPPRSLKLEITETAFVMDQANQLELVKRLQGAGFIIEMDDFGSGYSSLNTLKDIPVDVLKMDMKFLSQSEDMQRSQNILQMIVALSKSLGMPVIAEGVETKSQADYLSTIGCENIQGYYYAKPMKQAEYEQYLQKYEYQDII